MSEPTHRVVTDDALTKIVESYREFVASLPVERRSEYQDALDELELAVAVIGFVGDDPGAPDVWVAADAEFLG